MSHRNLIALAAVALLALAGNAMATDVVYYTGDIWAGQTTDIGTMTATMHYTNEDEASLEIEYQTTGSWRLTECHLWIGDAPPASRGAPGRYPYNSGSINTATYSVSISIADLRDDFGIDWGDDVYVMPHCVAYRDVDNDCQYDRGEQSETGYGGCVKKPKKGSWFGFFCFDLTKPEEEKRQPYPEATFGCGYWASFWSATGHTDQDVLDYLGDGTEVTDGVTLAGQNFKAASDLATWYALAGTSNWRFFVATFITLYCNTITAAGLDEAIYDYPGVSGEFMEGETVADIIGIANGYRENETPYDTYYAMEQVFENINLNSDDNLGCLWEGSQGRTVPLGQTARLTVSPNPFTDGARIRLQNSLQPEAMVSVYDLSGKKVNELNCNQVWNGTDARGRKLAPGVYLLRLVSGTQSVAARAVISH